MSSRKILSIVSAEDGWVAKFKQEDGTIMRHPVMVWAVVQDEKGEGNSLTSFCGPTGPDDSPGDTYMEPDNEASNFTGWERLGYDVRATAAIVSALGKPVFPTLNLGTRAKSRVMRYFKGTYLSEFIQLSANEILSWRNAGEATLDEIRLELHRVGLSLKGDY